MNVISIGSINLSEYNIVHNSARTIYREPLGAVAMGTEVSINLGIKDINVEKVYLHVLREGFKNDVLMEKDGDFFRAKYIVPNELTVLWYWFEIILRGGAIVYYGSTSTDNSGIGQIYLNPPPSFQITVHDHNFVTPDWTKTSVMYQIFPDRFCIGDIDAVKAGVEYHRNLGRSDVIMHESWNEMPDFRPRDGQEHYTPCDMFGGDLEGIRTKLSYLKEMGISLIYLNPIFESDSNHRYNTADYLKVDPILGGEGKFDALLKEAKELGIRVILDGVFSHTGDDSIYFNKYSRYPDVGAYQSQESKYFGWYTFSNYPDYYQSWWGFDTLPEVNEYNGDWLDFVIEGEDSVIASWIKKGAAGYRLDVADELPDDIIEKIRTNAKKADPDAFILGEVWEDATTKQSYNVTRQYAFGRGLDSVMNYPLRNATIAFLLGKIRSWTFRKFLVNQRLNYPLHMYYSLMNLMSSHDVARIRTMLSRDVDPRSMNRETQAVYSISEEEDSLGAKRQKLAAVIQFSLPGIPSVYYGDEYGMTGLLDPFNRQTFMERDAEMKEFYAKIASIRNANKVLSTGNVIFYSTDGNVLGILRYNIDGKDAFGNPASDSAILTVINPTDISHHIVMDFTQEKECQPPEHLEIFAHRNWQCAKSLLCDSSIEFASGLLDIQIPPLTAEMYEIKWD